MPQPAVLFSSGLGHPRRGDPLHGGATLSAQSIERPRQQLPRLVYNPLSAVGAAIALMAVVTFGVLLAISLSTAQANPYFGIFMYMALPPVLVRARARLSGLSATLCAGSGIPATPLMGAVEAVQPKSPTDVPEVRRCTTAPATTGTSARTWIP